MINITINIDSVGVQYRDEFIPTLGSEEPPVGFSQAYMSFYLSVRLSVQLSMLLLGDHLRSL